MTVDDHEIEELLDFHGARTRITTDESRLILTTLDLFEIEVNDHIGWDAAPALYLIHGSYGPLGCIARVGLHMMPISERRWWPDPGATLDYIAGMATDAPDAAHLFTMGVAADRVPLGVAFASEGLVRTKTSDPATTNMYDNPEVCEDEVRMVAAADLDGRQYMVTRMRRTGQRGVDVQTSQRASRDIAASTDPQVRWMRETHEQGAPRSTRALQRIAQMLARGK